MGKNKFHVQGLKIKDLRNIDIVEVDFQEKGFVEINGNNMAGKSTILDALFLTILGKKYIGKGFPVWQLIKQGKDKALMRVNLKSGERTVEIKRSITKKVDEETGVITSGGSLSIKDTEGKELKQSHLDSLINEFTVDPVSFSREAPKKQIEIVKRLAGINTDAIEAEKEITYKERTDVNREVTRLKAKTAEELEEVKPVDLEILTRELDGIEIFNRSQTLLKESNNGFDLDLKYCQETVNARKKDIEDINTQITALKEELKKGEALLLHANKVFSLISGVKKKEPEELESNEAVKLKMKNAQTTNEDAAKYTQYLDDKKELKEKKAEADKLTAKIKGYEEEKKKMILDSNLPFKNLTFDDEAGIIIGGVPFSQKSDAEKIRISTRIGMEDKPGLRLLCLKDGSLLDQKSYDVIMKMAEQHDYQVMVESVGERPGQDSIVMRDGRIVSQFEVVTTAAEEVKRMDEEL